MNCVIVCIGSDKISGDSLGPIVGSLLRERHGIPCPVFGVEGRTVNGLNLPEYRQFLSAYYPNTPIIAIDAAVGSTNEVGTIKVRKGGIKAGGALGRHDVSIGDIGILGVVGEKGTDPLSTLLAVPYPQVVNLAHAIANKIVKALQSMAKEA